MTKIDIFSGFLGAGKTTLIKKLIAEAYAGEKLVLIENEFGEIGIDGGFLREAGVTINEMNSGCICCSLVGDFGKALESVLRDYAPDRILIEPSGVGKLSDVIRAVQGLSLTDAELGSATVVVDAKKCRMYIKNFGEFFCDQVEHAGAIVLSRTGDMTEAAIATSVALLREHNPNAVIVTTPWDKLTGRQILDAATGTNTLASVLAELAEEAHHHHHHHHDDDEECECGCHHDHGHHHHDHDEECECGCHHDHGHHHHDHDEECECGCHHDHHHHHHADEVFASFGAETARTYTREELSAILSELDGGEYGAVLRAKGIVAAADGTWLHFDYVPEESEVRLGAPDVTGRVCVIGSGIDEDKLKALFAL
ncbi:MAG: GTP-binding protein [Clostridia bacterium]|nr:GTP-binding protein [Clostridia bacterium]